MGAEYTATASQTVTSGGMVLFTDTAVSPKNCNIMHRTGAGNITLRGKHRYSVSFGANIAATTATTQALLALAINGEPIASSSMITTSVAAGDLNNVASSIYVSVPCGCCYNISVINTSSASETVQNANIIIEEVA